MDTKRLTRLALMTAVALILFTVELALPNLSPISGVKLGLANVVTVYTVYRYKPSEAAMVLLARIVLGTTFSGNVSSALYSLAGGVLCLLGMLLLKRVVPVRYMWLSSVFGAILHNTGQMAVATVLMGSTSVLAYYPVLTFSGCVAGLFTGLCAQYLTNRFTEDGHRKETL